MLLPVPAMLMEAMAAQLTQAVARLMFTVPMVARPTTIIILILPMLMEPMAAKRIPMMVREQLMGLVVDRRHGVMVAVPLTVLMVALHLGVMVLVLPKVLLAALLVGAMVLELQHQRAVEPEVGAGKHLTV